MKHARQHPHAVPFSWPAVPFELALVEPEIPPNTGNIARLCAATGSILHLIEPLGFRLTDAALKRAGLDYWDAVQLVRHRTLDEFLGTRDLARCFFFSARASRSYLEPDYRPGDTLIFGSETRGLPESLLRTHGERVFGIPVRSDRVRSLNLATAAAVVLYEALRRGEK